MQWRTRWGVLAGIVIAVVVWWAWRSRGGDTPARRDPGAPWNAAMTGPEAGDGRPSIAPVPPSSRSARVDHAPGTTADSRSAPPGPAAVAPEPVLPTHPARPPGAAPVPPPPAARAPADDPAGGLADRTGWNDPGVVKQLNREFMPLASECIEQAQARDRRLRGLLAFRMVLAPAGDGGADGKVIVASLELRPDNQIQDPALFECIRESSFALDGLKAPHDFDITMPIEPGNPGR